MADAKWVMAYEALISPETAYKLYLWGLVNKGDDKSAAERWLNEKVPHFIFLSTQNLDSSLHGDV